MLILWLNNEAMDWNFTYTKKNGKDYYMKMVEEKNCWTFQTKVMNVFLRSWWTWMTFSYAWNPNYYMYIIIYIIYIYIYIYTYIYVCVHVRVQPTVLWFHISQLECRVGCTLTNKELFPLMTMELRPNYWNFVWLKITCLYLF